ncbi:MAG: LpqB family beta-propeller domain-containing protein, partial [Acidimicrobiales bacterium]
MARRAEIPFEEIGRLPLPGMAVPVQIAFSPSDELLSYLYAPDGSLDRRLYVKHLGSPAEAPREIAIAGGRCSEDELTTAEKLRRERSRETGLGITSATWARDGDVLLVPLADGLHVLTGLSSRDGDAIETLVASSERGQIEDPRLSPDGTQVAFVRAGEVFVSTVADPGAGETRLTFSAEDGLFNGLAEYVAQEEMGRPHGYWWSPDGSHIAYTEVDERHISPYRIVHQADDGPGPSSYEEHRYPFAGGPNAIVRLGVVRASGGETIWMDTGEADSYLARVHFTASGGL